MRSSRPDHWRRQVLKLFEGKSLLILELEDMHELIQSAISGLNLTLDFIEEGELDEDKSPAERTRRCQRIRRLIDELSSIPTRDSDSLDPFIINLPMN